ncbi:argininosuccinate lyase [Aminivibrio sp.]|uniref:argininosuccinate lyase n=1 Tax=Aminivibrio sp. TaxID=1872489 RepID=UPI00345E0B3C
MIQLRERLKGKAAQEIVDLLFAPSIERDGKNIFEIMLDVDIVHVLMLGKTGILEQGTVSGIVSGLVKIKNEGFSAISVDPTIEDLHYNIEKTLIDRLGMDTGGRMHTARSRNDLGVTCSRIWLREKCIQTMKVLNNFRNTVLRCAEEHHGTVMTIYTHSQPAQPVTFGYYLSGAASSLERDFERLRNAYTHINQCPLGGGAIAGTAFPLDREFTSGLLGFDGVLMNAIDAVASRDYVMETLSALAIMMTEISRFAQDLYMWSTYEFNLLELDDSIAGTSSIMPQKKNPITLEHIKGKAAHTFAALISAMSVLKNAPFSHTRDVSQETLHLAADSFQETKSALVLFSVTLETIKANKEVMIQKARENFSTMTELADALVMDFGLSFRQAHQIVGILVSDLAEKNLSAMHITAESLGDAAISVLGKRLDISEDRLQHILDPSLAVLRHNVKGGTSPEEVKKSIALLEKTLLEDEKFITGSEEKLDAAKKQMNALIEAVRFGGRG